MNNRSSNVEPLDKYPAILEDIEAKWFALLLKAGLAEELAHELSLEAAEHLRLEWGGQKVYISKGVSYKLQRMKSAILSRWDGRNTLDLCREFRISDSYLRMLHEQARKEAVRRSQPDLFLDGPGKDDSGKE